MEIKRVHAIIWLKLTSIMFSERRQKQRILLVLFHFQSGNKNVS